MKTEALIALLARGPVAADPHTTERRLLVATAVGAAIAVAAMLSAWHLRPDLASASVQPMFWIKLAVPLALAAAAFVVTARLARPAGRARAPASAALAVVLVLALSSLAVVLTAPVGTRTAIVLGDSAAACVASIAFLSLPLGVAAFAALRTLAPTSPRAAGAAAGLLAGAVAAAVYALHCTETTLPFLATWYVLGMAAPATLGALLGPSLLRWR
jgi:hypothetical protein